MLTIEITYTERSFRLYVRCHRRQLFEENMTHAHGIPSVVKHLVRLRTILLCHLREVRPLHEADTNSCAFAEAQSRYH